MGRSGRNIKRKQGSMFGRLRCNGKKAEPDRQVMRVTGRTRRWQNHKRDDLS